MSSLVLDIAGAKVTIPAETLSRLWLAELRQTARPDDGHRADNPPRIGARWAGHGGIYAGTIRGSDARPDCHLIVHEDEATAVTWHSAKDWAGSLTSDPHADFALPTRCEQAVLFGNVPELFAKEWYWSDAPFAGDEQCAWSQNFYNGYQSLTHETRKLRARAVRREPIE